MDKRSEMHNKNLLYENLNRYSNLIKKNKKNPDKSRRYVNI